MSFELLGPVDASEIPEIIEEIESEGAHYMWVPPNIAVKNITL